MACLAFSPLGMFDSGRRTLGPRESFRRAGHEVMAARRFLKRANESGASSGSASTPRTWSNRIVNIGTGLMPEVSKPDAEDVGAPSRGPGTCRWLLMAILDAPWVLDGAPLGSPCLSLLCRLYTCSD